MRRLLHAGSVPLWGAGVRQLQVVDAHCGGEPARIVVGGLPSIGGASVVEQRSIIMEKHDALRTLLITEPRGYPCQNADFVLPSLRPDASFGVVVAEQAKIYPAMSGHNIICTATVLLETGMVPMAPDGVPTTFALDLPAGLVRVTAHCRAGRAESVTLQNAPAFCRPEDRDVVVDVPHVGKVTVDIAYGGMHYVIVDAAQLGLTLDGANGSEICRLGEMIKVACREQHPVTHPEIQYPGPDILVFREKQPPPTTTTTVLSASNADAHPSSSTADGK